jgi:hypothetical protein
LGFQDIQVDIEGISNIAVGLLKKLDREPSYVKELIEDICKKLQEEGWKIQNNERLWIRELERERYKLKIAIIHARKGEKITGADFFFEVKNKKIIFVQSKKTDPCNKIHFNKFQLQKLIELELRIYDLRYYRYRDPLFIYPIFIPFPFLYYPYFQIAFYHLIMNDKNQVDHRFFHIADITFTLGDRKSISQNEFIGQGLKLDEFYKMFWECKIGGPDLEEDKKKDVLELYSLATNRAIFWIHVEEK